MELKVLALNSPSDIPTIARIHLAAFLTNKFYRTVWPKGATPAVIASQESRHLHFLTSDLTVRYVKVVEYPSPTTNTSASGLASASETSTTPAHENSTIIAFAKWHIYTSTTAVATRQDASDRSWPPDCNVPCVEDFWSQLQAVRREWGPKLGPHLMLDILATDPGHMRRGAGKMLVGFGTDLADEMGLPCFLEGSPEGMGLYRACGFEVVGSIWVDLAKYQDGSGEKLPEEGRGGEEQGGPVEGVGEGWYSHAVMVRYAHKEIGDR